MHDYDDDEPTIIIEKRPASLGAFLLGATLGAAVALLVAPQSGIETRHGIGLRARRARDAAQGIADDVAGTVTDTFHQAREEVETRIDTARQALELKRQQVQRAMEAGRVAAQQARDELERRIAETRAAYEAGGDVVRAARTEPADAGAGSTAGGARRPAAAAGDDLSVELRDDEPGV